MFALVFGGEMIFSLPYHLPRYYRPTVLEVVRLSKADLGDAFVFYGVLAMIGLPSDNYNCRFRRMFRGSLIPG
ncbi:MAG: hypothetical protein OXD30_12400 [Bryobacterales bacterium]|nr:hypothetical protein [Bryobacterales bacterium]